METTQESQTKYEDLVAKTVLLAQQLPVGSYWKDADYIYKIGRIELTNNTASATCTRISIPQVAPMWVYNYQIQESMLFVSSIPNLSRSTEKEFMSAIEGIGKMYDTKNIELFQKQCLFNTPTDNPFEEFDVLHDEIIELQGTQYFFYEPTKNCFRIFSLDMNTYNGKDTMITDWHFFMNSDDKGTTILSAKRFDVGLIHIVNANKIFPITEYQFNALKELIENDPNKILG